MTLETEAPIAVGFPFTRTPTMSERQRLAVAAARQRVYRFIIQFKRDHDGNSPSSREIADGTGILSTNSVHYHLRMLEKQGKIHIERHLARRITVIGGRWTCKEGSDAAK